MLVKISDVREDLAMGRGELTDVVEGEADASVRCGDKFTVGGVNFVDLFELLVEGAHLLVQELAHVAQRNDSAT